MPSPEQLNELESYFDRLWPICRSLTGQGVRDTLDILGEIIPLDRHQVASGTKVFDWEIPQEWSIREAYIITPDGRKLADFTKNNLHVFSYSIPVDKELTYEELSKHVRTLPDQPDAIPYVTTYYHRNWGFCLSQREWDSLPQQGTYKVFIDSDLHAGHLDYGECVLKGSSDREILFSTYVCHPSMANNELSGPLVQAFLYRELAKLSQRKYTYRFVFTPETIGVITYLAQRGEHFKQKLDAGFVLTCVGDRGSLTYKRSKQGNSLADRATEHYLNYSGKDFSMHDFAVGGSDERQYCSPGFNLPVGSLMRTPYQQYKEYHTSLDNKSFISFEHLFDTVESYLAICQVMEMNECYYNQVQHCEPQLGKRGLYPASLNPDTDRENLYNLLHLLSFADGKTDLIEIAEKRKRSVFAFKDAIAACQEKGLL